MTLFVEELGIRVVLISCTWLLSIQTTQLSPFLHNQGEIMWKCCDWEIQVSTSGFELKFLPPQLKIITLSSYLVSMCEVRPATARIMFTQEHKQVIRFYLVVTLLCKKNNITRVLYNLDSWQRGLFKIKPKMLIPISCDFLNCDVLI